MKRNIHIYPDKEKLVTATTERLIDLIDNAIKDKGLCNMVLAGGNTPGDVYSMLARSPYKALVDWNSLHLFWGDERMVPPEHQDSNFGMSCKTLLDHVEIPDNNVHRIRGEIAPDKAAEEYTELLNNHFKTDLPGFDIILLGLGEDGHTASIFPETEVVDECERTAVDVFIPRLDSWRVTLTLPVLNAAREIIFLVSGRSKSDIIQRILSIKQPSKKFPATMVDPVNGVLNWMLDSEAMILVNKNSRDVMFP